MIGIVGRLVHVFKREAMIRRSEPICVYPRSGFLLGRPHSTARLKFSAASATLR
jgi:hypothetical protein